MAWKIQITRAKPNPAGKDKAGNYPLPEQLLGEWVDLKNVGDGNVALSSLHLANIEFGPNCEAKRSVIYWKGSSAITLKPSESVRIHTGRSCDINSMKVADQTGTTYRVFAEKGTFVLNNKCGDTLSVWWKHNDAWNKDDEASYRPNPPEGAVLVRVGTTLTPATAAAGVAR